MDDKTNEAVVIPELKDIEDKLGSSLLYVSRTNFDRTPINFGGKVFFDMLPIEIEASMNFGVWNYNGRVKYASSFDTTGGGSVVYDSLDLSIKSITGDSYFGLESTPYTKFNVDLTLKKTLKKIPIIKPSFGAGISVHFASPVLSNKLVQDALGSDFKPEDLEEILKGDGMDLILDKITEGTAEAKTGMHILIGLKAKIPVIPIAIYADGKYMIMFNDIEENVGLKTNGILLNTGILLNF
jgi:hypothetical protein